MAETLPHSPAPTRRTVVMAGAGLILSSCAMFDRGPKTTDLRFIVEADDLINPNSANEASPVVLRIYELKQLAAFQGASLFQLLDTDTTVLGQELVAKREMELKPGEKTHFDRATPVETHYLGVIAAFRSVESAKWRATVEFTPEKSGLVVIKVTAQSVTMEMRRDKTLGLF